MQLSLCVIYPPVSLAHQFCNICSDIGHIPTVCFIYWSQLADYTQVSLKTGQLVLIRLFYEPPIIQYVQ